MADTRDCQQCGGVFVPRREHARFCSVGCRVEWNREHMGDLAVEASALEWSITAMGEIAGRLAGVGSSDPQRAVVLIGEAVWWVTIVDATLVRHHVRTYDSVMSSLGPAQRRVIEGTMAGLRFVRNQLGHKVDLGELAGPGVGARRAWDWIWRPVPEPSLPLFSLRARTWEMTRYQAYQAWLAGHAVGEVFGRAVQFLQTAGAGAVPVADPSLEATR